MRYPKEMCNKDVIIVSGSLTHSDIVDYLKAFAAILVVIGHAFSYMSRLQGGLSCGVHVTELLIYSVHVPLFFVIAGYLCRKKNNIWEFYKLKLLRIVVPYLTFATLKLVYSFFISKEFIHSSDLVNVLFDAFGIGRLYWFAYCIFIMYLLAPLFWGEENRRRAYIALIALCCVNVGLCLYSTKFFPESITLGTVMLHRPFFQLINLMNFWPYFLVGLLLQEKWECLKAVVENRKILIGLDLVLIVVITSILVTMGFKNPFPTKFVLAFLLMYVLYLGATKISSNNVVLKIVGKYSYQIMFFDSFYKVVLFKVWMHFLDMTIVAAIILSLVNMLLACVSCKVIERIPFVKVLFGLK